MICFNFMPFGNFHSGALKDAMPAEESFQTDPYMLVECATQNPRSLWIGISADFCIVIW